MSREPVKVWNNLLSAFICRCLLSRAHKFRRTRPQMAVFAHDFIGMEINVYGRYEDRELHKISGLIADVDRSKLVLDVGANIGNHTLFFVQEGFERICAFEPNPRTVKLLEFNTELLSQVEVYPFGLSREDAILEAVVPPTNIGGASIKSNNKTIGLDRVLYTLKRFDGLQLASGEVGLLKLDVEGHEAEVIEGMRSTLRRDSPQILFECNRKTDLEAADALLTRLREIGYENFVAIEPPRSVIPNAIHYSIRRPLRFIERLFFLNHANYETKEIVQFEEKNYPMILGSRSTYRTDQKA